MFIGKDHVLAPGRGQSGSRYISQTLHGTAIYADQLTPLAPPRCKHKKSSPMECLVLGIYIYQKLYQLLQSDLLKVPK